MHVSCTMLAHSICRAASTRPLPPSGPSMVSVNLDPADYSTLLEDLPDFDAMASPTPEVERQEDKSGMDVDKEGAMPNPASGSAGDGRPTQDDKRGISGPMKVKKELPRFEYSGSEKKKDIRNQRNGPFWRRFGDHRRNFRRNFRIGRKAHQDS